MKQIIALFLLSSFLILACTPSKPLDLAGLSNAQFETLTLQPSYELYDLRIDILRQEDCEENIDSTTSWVSRPYHPVGFDLGNGLFFDLNYNLSLRIDQALDLNGRKSFKLKSFYNIKHQNGYIYTIDEDSYCYIDDHPRKLKREICFTIDREEKSFSIFDRKDRHRYSVEITDSSLVYVQNLNRRKSDIVIVKKEEGSYLISQKKNPPFFTAKGNELRLDERYLIRRSNAGKLLEILAVRKKGNDVIYSIEKSRNSWYVYDQKQRGKTINIRGREIEEIINDKVNYRVVVMEK